MQQRHVRDLALVLWLPHFWVKIGLRGEIIPGKNINHLSWGEKNEDEKFSAFSPTFVDCVTRSLEIIEAETHLVRRHKNAEWEKKSRRYAKCKGELGQHKDFPCKVRKLDFWSKSTAACDPCIFEEKNASWQKLIASMVCASFGAKVRCRIMHLSLPVQSSTTTHTEWILIESKWRTISPYPDAEPMPLVSGFVGQACFCFPRICIVLQEVAGNMHRLYSSLLWPNCLFPFTHSAASSTFIGFADLL